MSFDFSLLDKLIAFVLVTLLLSLIVQTIQSAFKKLLKIKSRQIEDSLLDLFQNALNEPPDQSTGFMALIVASPLLKILTTPFRWLWQIRARRRGVVLPAVAVGSAEHLRTQVLDVFGQLGRFAQSGRPMLDSLAKNDLIRVLGRLKPHDLLGETKGDTYLQSMLSAVNKVVALTNEIQAIAGNAALRGEASAKFSAFRAAIAPLLTDCEALRASDPPKLQGGLLIQDVLALRKIQPQDVMDLLGTVQKEVQADLAALPADQSRDALTALIDALSQVARDFGTLQRDFDVATAALRNRCDSVTQWFDTVMQSFDERYARSMKTWGIVIAGCVVIALNANFFHIYGAIANNAAVRQQILDQSGRVQELAKTVNDTAAQGQAAVAKGDGQGAADNLAKIQDTTKASAVQVQTDASIYSDMGFKPLAWSQVANGFRNLSHGAGLRHILAVLCGWSVMILLLSAGAPFWEDTLESLFGLKNLIRKGSDTQNIEVNSGAGQPKP